MSTFKIAVDLLNAVIVEHIFLITQIKRLNSFHTSAGTTTKSLSKDFLSKI
ncbi:hypothetical protein QGM71_03480 [Virgibacillus sp. C22-A2]|uniref:Uncharacterized protein n=1 Tax=Virgibacillus tibetensis TaxID=3042313 RepID=A0ABU6KBT5_9BACI|nr:hypothetical protein [Virgibacillus sp. C22-A2]